MDVNKQPDKSTEEINNEFNKLQSEISQGNQSQADSSLITTPDEDERIKEEMQRKEEKLRLLIQQEVDTSNKMLMQNMPQVVMEVINQMRAQQEAQQGQTTQPQNPSIQPGASPNLAALDPTALTGIATQSCHRNDVRIA